MLSPGTVYSTLYLMERKGLLKGEMKRGKRFFHLTDKGKDVIQNINSLDELMKSLSFYFEVKNIIQ
jgi:DNA-binding PadR family transcriptional regulator